MVTDQEPRYRLVDADGNVVGSLFAESDGTLKLQEGSSGNDNEVSLQTDGAVAVPTITANEAIIGGRELLTPDANGDVTDSGSSVTINLADSYDIIHMRVLNLNTFNSGTTAREIELQVNGFTSGYVTHRVSGASTSSAWVLGEATEFGNGRMAGETRIYNTKNSYTLKGGLTSEQSTDPVLGGNRDGNDQKISSLTFSSPDGVDIDIEVFASDY